MFAYRSGHRSAPASSSFRLPANRSCRDRSDVREVRLHEATVINERYAHVSPGTRPNCERRGVDGLFRNRRNPSRLLSVVRIAVSASGFVGSSAEYYSTFPASW